jgi:hypothetical protein
MVNNSNPALDNEGLATERSAAPPLIWLLLALAAIALVGGVLFLWNANAAPAEASPEVTFARDMSAHHNQAVEMALILRDRTEDPDLRLFALDIMLTQQAQIGQMQGWLSVWQRPLQGAEAPMAGHGVMMGMATQAEVNELRELPVAEAETRFHTYKGNRIPWYVRLMWLGFWVFAVYYVITYLFPDLQTEILNLP